MGAMKRSNKEWKEKLSPEEYHILREKGTEQPFTGKYADYEGEGVYSCAGCGQELFRSREKFHFGTGWPSFWNSVSKDKVTLHKDTDYGMARTEVSCSKCGGHLGHLFDDGPKPTGLRYCINSVALKFKERGE